MATLAFGFVAGWPALERVIQTTAMICLQGSAGTMWKSLGLIAVGVVVGIALYAVLQQGGETSESPAAMRETVMVVDKLSSAAVDAMRDENFETVRSVEDLLAMPTRFSRIEASYVLAGRAGASELQTLIYDADRVSNRSTRDSLLGIFFMRLAEIDPQSGLALARVEPYSQDSGLENSIWRTWALNNLEEALFEVKAQTRRSDKVAAAQVLFSAHGFMGNETTDRIEAELGISPDRGTRLRYMRTLLKKSPDNVIDFIGKEPSGLRRREYINWFVYALDESQLAAADPWADRFNAQDDESLFSFLLKERRARLNPMQSLENALASRDFEFNGRFHSALEELASRDIEGAKSFYERLDSTPSQNLGLLVIANEMANTNPAEALEWLRDSSSPNKQAAIGAILVKVAESDPQMAFNEAIELSGQAGTRAMSRILMSTIDSDAGLALSMLDGLPKSVDEQSLRRQFGESWLLRNPAAAIDWLKTLPDGEASNIASRTTRRLAITEPEVIDQVLPLIQGANKRVVVRDLISQFAAKGDLSRARAMTARYSEEEGFDAGSLQASYLGGVAQLDLETAKQLALQTTDPAVRDKSLETMAREIAFNQPQGAADIVDNITDRDTKLGVVGRVATQWYRKDPDSAIQWVSSLRDEAIRQAAITDIVRVSKNPGRQELRVVESIADPLERDRVKGHYAISVARNDKAAAERILEGLVLPADEKAAFQQRIERQR
ncbi:MAG: hypothetical protein AAF917_11225 [Pseudomonadota bacterium]